MESPTVDPVATTRLVLRDGSTAGLRPALPSDRDAMRSFFQKLSPASRRRRFMATIEPSDSLINQLCDNSDTRRAFNLVVCRTHGGSAQIVGVGSYFSTRDGRAEVAFAISDRFQGKGIATALLEQLAATAAENGFSSFEATVLPENIEMLDVFHDSGFERGAKTDQECVDVYLSLTLSPEGARASDERDRLATIASLRAILEPRAIAVVGTSRDESNLGRRIFESLLVSGIPVYPVNSAVTELRGLRCYKSARELPEGVDLAVIAVPREAVLGVVDDCATVGVKGIVVISAGFAESGLDGRTLQAQLVERARGYGMRMVGPNCMGILSTRQPNPFNASFAPNPPQKGRIALSSQSGGLGLAILALAAKRQIGLSTFVSLGNKADISGNDLLQYGERDPQTSVIALYLESFGNPRRFARLARRISRQKPIVVVKTGRTPAGIRAAASHTAGLAASEVAIDGLFRQTGVIRADTIDEMFDVSVCLDSQPLPPGRRVAIVTNAGGPGILATDACSAAGLSMSELSEITLSRLASFLPKMASLANPVDMLASAGSDEYKKTIATLLSAGEVDAVVAIYTTIDAGRTDETLSAIQDGVSEARKAGGLSKPVLVCTMASDETVALHTSSETLPVYTFPEHAVRALGKAAAYSEWRREPAGSIPYFGDIPVSEARSFCQRIVQTRGDTWLTLDEIKQLLAFFGISVVPGSVARSADEAATMARLIGFPVAAKISSPSALHKTELGGVQLNLINEQSVRAAFAEMTNRVRTIVGDQPDVLIQPMFRDAVETIVGLTADPMFGPLVAFGLGGVYVDLFRDVAFRIAPLTSREADDLLHSVRGFPMLEAHRGQPAADLGALRDLLVRVAYLGEQIPELLELDLNPVLARPSGYEAIDARVRLGPAYHEMR